ncbi:HTH-type dhaKLM operon transcriptional activator dhaS [Chlamydia trachomatis]|nr:HTH-type dhaKLM operon transcriptional activator dhaS [Chlamydia trachomatis]
MSGSIITKKKIANAFKTEIECRSFDSISVSQIMKHAHIRRQTFYDCFIDKYDLVDWIFQNDLHEQISDRLDFLSGLDLLQEVFYFFEKHVHYYAQLFKIVDQNDFSTYFLDYCEQLIRKIFDEELHGADIDIAPYISYHSIALSNVIRYHVMHENFNREILFKMCKNTINITLQIISDNTL